MIENNENFFENNLFRFDNDPCDCVTDTINLAPGTPPTTTIKVQAIPGERIHFAFSSGVGLVRLGEKGALVEKNLLGSLISIKPGDTAALFEYFRRNGFLFNISGQEYEPIDTDKMFELIRRLRTTVELLSAMGAIRKDYHKILGLSLYLMLSSPIEISFTSLPAPYRTCKHALQECFERAYSLPTPDYFQQEMFSKDSISIPDTLVAPAYELDSQLYMGCLEGSGQESYIKGSSSDLFKSVLILYAHGLNEHASIRRAVDLIFHYFCEVGTIKDINEDGSIEYYGKPDTGKLTNEMKSRILAIAKLAIAEEINANMGSIHPMYDAEKMTPSWHVDSLIGGLYFSIFYMKPDLELFRRCRQCGQFFTVKATSTRKVYCDDICRNRYQQSMHRKRKREKEEKEFLI